MSLFGGMQEASQPAAQVANMQQLLGGLRQQQPQLSGDFLGVNPFRSSQVGVRSTDRTEIDVMNPKSFYTKLKTEITEWLKINI